MARHKKRIKHCMDCGAEIDRRSARCNSCATKARWVSGVYGEETLRKMSDIMRARWQRGDFDDPEIRQKHSDAIKAAWERGDLGTSEHLRKKSEAVKAAWDRGEFDGIFTTEEFRYKCSERAHEQWTRGDFDSIETRRRKSEAMKAAWARGDMANVFSDETRHKMSQSAKRRWERDDYSAEQRRKNAESTKAQWARGAMDGVFQSPTSIELQVAAALDMMGIEHTPQYRPNGYSRIYDEFVPPNILIEVQGDYWHGDNFPKQQKRDAEKAQWAKEHGFQFIVLWECDIKEYGAWALVATNKWLRVYSLKGR